LRQLKGIPVNLRGNIIGKITRDVTAKKEKNIILVAKSVDRDTRGFRAILCEAKIDEIKVKQIRTPMVHSVHNIEDLSEGDVVKVDMESGDIIVVYEIKSIHNSIIASTVCNCRCIMCPQALADDSPESLKSNLEIIQLIDKDTPAIGITGGEPTLLGDRLIRLLEECQKRLPKTQIQMLTNGILLSNLEYVKKIVRLRMNNLLFCIPLYADIDREHDFIMQRNRAFEDTILGLYNLAARKQLVEIRIVVMSLNYRRLVRIAEFIYRNLPFVIHVAFMGLEVEGQARKYIQRLWASPVEYAPFLREAVIHLSRRNIDVSIYNEQLCLMPREIWSFMRKSISEWKNTYLEKCRWCKVKNDCAGLFAHPTDEHKCLVKPF